MSRQRRSETRRPQQGETLCRKQKKQHSPPKLYPKRPELFLPLLSQLSALRLAQQMKPCAKPYSVGQNKQTGTLRTRSEERRVGKAYKSRRPLRTSTSKVE